MLTELLINAASNYPNKPAIVSVKNTISYSDLLASSICFADHLSTRGIKKYDTVAVLLPNGPEFVTCTFATAKLGAVIVPINTQYREEELKFYLKDSSASVIITTPELEPLCSKVVDQLESPLQILTEVKLVNNGNHRLQATIEGNRGLIDSEGLYQYSTGSTGTPKRVTRTQRQLKSEADNFHQTVGTTHEDRILAVAPFFHAHGFGNCVLAAVRVGATLVVIESFGRRQQVIKTLIEEKITIFPGVPFMFSILADAPSISTEKLTHLRLAFSAGAQLNRETFDGFFEKFGVEIKQLYGSTETGSISINIGSTDGDQWQSVGKPMHNVQVRIVKESGENAQVNEVGEIVIKSNAMTKGYANLPEVSKTSFIGGEFWSGDLGKKDSNGNIYITGRKKLFINAAGNKVDPGEIENLLLTLPKVKEAVVLGIKGSYGLESIKAVIVSDGECQEQEIRDWCQGKIADFKIPRIIEFRDEIPKSPLGKVLRKYLIDGI